MAGVYEKEVRYQFRGNPELAGAFVHEGRKRLGMMLQDMMLSGNRSGSWTSVNGQGVKFTVTRTLDAPPTILIDITRAQLRAEDMEDVVYAYVSNRTAGTISVIDVDKREIVQTITGVGQIDSMEISPNGDLIYALTTISASKLLIRIDIDNVSATGISGTLGFDVMVSPDGDRVYLRYAATGTPGGSGTYGGVRIYDGDLNSLGSYPNQLFGGGTLLYGGAVNPANGHLCLAVFGDGDGDTDPGDHEADEFQDAFEVYDTANSSFVGGFPLLDPYLASQQQHRGVAINAAGTRAYVVRSSGEAFIDSDVDVPAVVCVNIDGTVARSNDALDGVDLTGCIAVTRGGNLVFVAGDDGNARVLTAVGDSLAQLASFPYCPAVVGTETQGNDAIKIGPKGGMRDDNRIYFLSDKADTLWVFEPGRTVPKRQLSLIVDTHHFVLRKKGVRPRIGV